MDKKTAPNEILLDDSSAGWLKICGILSRELSENSFKTWFSPVRCLSITDSAITLSVPDSYYGQWLKDHYEDLLASAVKEVLEFPRQINYQVVAPPKVQAPAPIERSSQYKSEFQGTSSNLKTGYTFDQFVIGPGNRFAQAAAFAITESPAKQYNPLFIYGPAGLGKTHLMQAIAHETQRRNPNYKVLYLSSEKFTNQLIAAIQTKTTQQFRNKYRNVDLLLVDDIHFIAGKEATQEEFFHTFNTLHDAHKQIVAASDRSPKEIPGLEERLVSRFCWGLVTDIQPPDFETRVAILKKKMEKETVQVSDDVCYFIASKIRSNIRELEGALIRVVAYCSLTGHAVDLKKAQEILKDSVTEEEQNISIERIQRVVADFFNLKVSDLRAKRRSQSIARPRQIAMFLVRSLTSHSLPEIGEYFGGRDHTTVLHAFNKIEKEIEVKIDLRKTIDEIKELLKRSG